MTEDQQKIRQFCELVLKFRDGDILDEEREQLQKQLRESPQARAYYIDTLILHSIIQGRRAPSVDTAAISALREGFEQAEGDGEAEEAGGDIRGILQQLIEEERTSPAISVPNEEAEKEAGPSGRVRSRRRKPLSNKERIVFIGRIAAIILIAAGVVLLDRWFQGMTNRPKEVVAILSDQIEAEWDKAFDLPQEDGRLHKGHFGLREGYVKIRCNGGADLVLEAPAEWTLNAEDHVYLYAGRAYSRVPEEAVGFTINTDNAKVIDLGTEFGVNVDGSQTMELHVIKGETLLISGNRQRKKAQSEVAAGHARRIDNSGRVSPIQLAEERYVRNIDSRNNLIWKGQTALDLADIVGGGNGFGSGQINRGVNHRDAHDFQLLNRAKSYRNEEGFKPFVKHDYIDGVFIPNTEAGAVIISSEGHRFADSPEARGTYWVGLINGAWHEASLFDVNRHQLRLGGTRVGDAKHPALYMHASQGVTFDLTAMRKVMKEFRITGFTAQAGLSESILNYPQLIQRAGDGSILSPRASFYVLVDGETRFAGIDRSPGDEPLAIRVELDEQDRFLTLVTTPGSDGTNEHDWTLFAEPFLQLEER